jgi:hypothetical protein
VINETIPDCYEVENDLIKRSYKEEGKITKPCNQVSRKCHCLLQEGQWPILAKTYAQRNSCTSRRRNGNEGNAIAFFAKETIQDDPREGMVNEGKAMLSSRRSCDWPILAKTLRTRKQLHVKTKDRRMKKTVRGYQTEDTHRDLGGSCGIKRMVV